MTVDQRARESAAAVRAARAEAEFTTAPPGGRPPSRRRGALAAAGAGAVLLLVGIPAALLLGNRGTDPAPNVTGAAAEPVEQPAPVDPTRATRPPSEAELDTAIRYLRSYSIAVQDDSQFVFANEQWLHPGGEAVGAAAASTPRAWEGELVIDAAEAQALLDSVEVVGERAADGVSPYGFADRFLPGRPEALEAALTSGPGIGGPLFSPGEALSPDGSGLDRRGLILRTVPTVMAPVLDPGVAAAFFELTTGLDDAVVREGATDPLGRPAVEVAVPVPMFDDAGAEVGRLAYVTWFDADTKLVVGQRSELESGAFPFDGHAGPIVRMFVIADRGVVDAMPPFPEPPPEEARPEWSATPTSVVGPGGAQYLAADGSTFASSQLHAASPALLDLTRGNLECAEDCRSLDGPRSLHLTIDPVLQSELEPYMAADAFAGRDGAAAIVMVMDSETGAVLALAGDADAAERDLVALAFDTRTFPDTALLPILLVAALEDGRTTDAAITPTEDCGPAPATTPAEALAAASEPALCQLHAELGGERIEIVGRLLGVPRGEEVSVADIATMFAAIANGGGRPHPHLVDRIEGAGGVMLGAQLYDDHLVLDPAAASTVAGMLDGLPGYAGGAWHVGSAGGVTVVVWAELGRGPAAEAWAVAMELAQPSG